MALFKPDASKSLFIDGAFRAPTPGAPPPLELVNPANEQLLATVPSASQSDVDAAVAAAASAVKLGAWRARGGAGRAPVLRAIAAGVKRRTEALARLESYTGKPMPESIWDIEDVVACFEYYAEQAEALDRRQGTPVALPDDDYTCELHWAPVGVAALIVPWNYPLLMAAWKVAPALAAGCDVVLKPSELSPLSALQLGAIATEAGLPAGLLNVLAGGGAVGAWLAAHPRVDKVAFTGSERSGVAVAAAAARDVRNVSLELGGKSAVIVFDDVAASDAELDKAVEWVLFGCFWTNGQICSATSRLLIHEKIAPAFLRRLAACAKAIPLCDPLDAATADATGVLGPVVSKAQYDKVVHLVNEAIADGARVLAGGRRPPSKPKGYYIEPTVLQVEPSRHAIWRTEVFGPVLSVATFRDEAEAIALANGTAFGLAAAVLTADAARGKRVAEAMEAGIVWVQCSQPCFCQAPWGGVKRSGIGRELGTFGIDGFLEPKQVTTYVSKNPLGWYTLPKSRL